MNQPGLREPVADVTAISTYHGVLGPHGAGASLNTVDYAGTTGQRIHVFVFAVVVLSPLFVLPVSKAQQLNVNRIELMPNLPSPYQMRDWKQVANGYDQFVFDFAKTGTHLPLGWKYSATVNYPTHPSFGLDTVVGTPRDDASEGINVLPAVVGASLVGIDKSNQTGENWVLMTEEYFNRRPEENVYLNSPTAQSGNDWWYDVMPNVFFYQLNDLYPGTGDFEFQFASVADQWLTAVEHMGGKAAPWRVPNMNYRAWSLSTMTGTISGVKEPEAAGAIGWILYNAYTETGDEQYRRGAEWAMEYLSALTSNPSYELQLPYGAYTAARMNAELGTTYNTEKIVNWTFDVGPLRSWGALLGNWGGLDMYGLIGEDSANDYAFMMNGYQQAGALVPMVRYDDRFARAIGKWVLNLANASRFFYPNYLPANNQDSEEWSFVNDPDSYIGHEAIRHTQAGQTPYATGDAVSGGWGFTNLVLYGSSHVGYLAGLLDTTDVAGVLQLDVLKTDFYGNAAYATHLYYNPFVADTTINIDLGAQVYDLYDLASNQFVANGVTGTTPISLPADQAMLIARIPVGAAVTFELDHMLADGIVVDYRSGQPPANYPPRIKGLDSGSRELFMQDRTTVYCSADDRDDTNLSYTWSVTGGSFVDDGPMITWKAPTEAGSFAVICEVSDGRDGMAIDSLRLSVLSNYRPTIDSLKAEPQIIEPLESTTVLCAASDLDGDDLTYAWETITGGLIVGNDSSVIFTAPDEVGYYPIRCTVSDPDGTDSSDTTGVVVGRLVADMRFTGNGLDGSGMDNHATIVGAPLLVEDRDGHSSAAYLFDGVDDALSIPNHPSLAFEDAVTVSFWMKPTAAPNRESFIVSHGSWQNRWKVSLTPDQVIRWTINTNAAITDLDLGGALTVDSLYHIAATYGDDEMKLYRDGLWRATGSATGMLNQTSYDLTIGQMLPGDSQFNFVGVIDDVKIYNRVLTESEIFAVFNRPTGRDEDIANSRQSSIDANYPNPFSISTTITYTLAQAGRVTITVFDLAGRRVSALLDESLPGGTHALAWDGRDGAGKTLPSGVYAIRFETVDRVQYRKVIRINDQQ